MMKLSGYHFKRIAVRAFTAIGAALGLASCFHAKHGPDPRAVEAVYGPPEDFDKKPKIEIIEDVYGPPVELDSLPDTELTPQPDDSVQAPTPKR